MSEISFAFFGTGPLAESVLASLCNAGFIPKLLVTKPDSPQGRNMEIKPPHIKTWCELKGIKIFQPVTLREIDSNSPLHGEKFDVFIVASYGKLIPEEILNIPKKGVLNVHPSLLPKYRGPSPIETALLNGDEETGVTIIKLDNEMDHGQILVQTAFKIDERETGGTLEVTCGQIGGELLVQSLSHYLDGTLIPKEQKHSEAVICKKITKDLGEIKLDDDVKEVRNKFRALTPWPSLYFFIKHKDKEIRVKITKIDLIKKVDNETKTEDIISFVIPEGKKGMSFEDFKRGYLSK